MCSQDISIQQSRFGAAPSNQPFRDNGNLPVLILIWYDNHKLQVAIWHVKWGWWEWGSGFSISFIFNEFKSKELHVANGHIHLTVKIHNDQIFFFNTAELFQTIQNGIRGFHLFWTKKVKSTCCSLSSTFNDYFCLKLIKRKLVWEDIYSTEQLWCPRTGSRPCLPVSVLALHWAPTWPWVNVSSLSVLVFSSAKWGHSSTNLVEQFWSFSRTVLTKPGKWDL